MSAGSGRDPPELPGFYYDRERNRYFRLLPGTNNHNPRPCSEVSPDIQDVKRRQRCNVVKLLSKRSCGLGRGDIFKVDCINSKLNSYTSRDAFPETLYPVKTVLRIQHDSEYERLVEYTAEQSHSSIGYCTYVRDETGILIIAPFHHTSEFCFLPDSTALLYSNMVGKTITMVDTATRRKEKLVCPDPHTCASAGTRRFKYFFSCNAGQDAFLVSNLEAFLSNNSLHPRGGSGYTAVRLPSTVLSQHFSQCCPVHLNGLRGGMVLGLDMRNLRKKSYCYRLTPSTRSNPVRIHAMRDNNSVLVGYNNPGINPKISLWDLRFTTKPILQLQTALTRQNKFEGLLRFCFDVNEPDGVVTSVLPDCRARFWSTKTGDVLHMYPNDTELQNYATAVAYSNNWGLMNGKSGALVFVEEPTHKGYRFLDISS